MEGLLSTGTTPSSFNSKLRKSINVELAVLNMVKESKPKACFRCCNSPVNYRPTADKLVDNLLYQNITGYSGDQSSKWCSPAHFVEKPNRVPLALKLIVDFSFLNSCLIWDQAQAFPTGEEIRQLLDPECCYRATSDALSTCFRYMFRRGTSTKRPSW